MSKTEIVTLRAAHHFLCDEGKKKRTAYIPLGEVQTLCTNRKELAKQARRQKWSFLGDKASWDRSVSSHYNG